MVIYDFGLLSWKFVIVSTYVATSQSAYPSWLEKLIKNLGEWICFLEFLYCCTQVPFTCFMTTVLLICRCGRFPPEVRTAIPVEGRFEHVVLSCSTTSDHAIAWIERESQKALEVYTCYTTCC